MLIYPFLMEKGFKLYSDIIQPYMPILPYTLLYWFHLSGFSVWSLRIFTILLILISDVLFIKIANNIFKLKTSLTALLIFIGFQVYFEGNGLWFDLFATPFMLFSALIFIRVKTPKFLDIIWIGILLGTSFIVKQSTAWVILGICCLLVGGRKIKLVGIILFVSLIPVFLVMVIFGFVPIYQWALHYPFFEMTKSPGFMVLPSFKQLILIIIFFSPVFPALSSKNPAVPVLITFFLGSLGFLIPRFAMFHFQPLVPYFVLLLCIAFSEHSDKLFRLFIGLYIIFSLCLLTKFFLQNTLRPVRFFEPEVYAWAALIKQKIPSSKPIFFYNVIANEILLTGFTPVKPWVDNFPWYMEIPGIQNRIIDEIEVESTEWVIAAPFKSEGKYVPGSYKPAEIDVYLHQKYIKVDNISPELEFWKRIR